MNIDKKIKNIKPKPSDGITNIPILELCEILEELNHKIEAIEDRIEEVETKRY